MEGIETNYDSVILVALTRFTQALWPSHALSLRGLTERYRVWLAFRKYRASARGGRDWQCAPSPTSPHCTVRFWLVRWHTVMHTRPELNRRWRAAQLAETVYLGPSVVVFRAVTPCSLVGVCWCFGVTAWIFRVEKWPTLRVTAPVACPQNAVAWSVYIFHIRQSRVCISDRRPVV